MPNTATLSIEGAVEHEQSFDYDSLAAVRDQIPDVSKLAPDRAGGAVRLNDLLEKAGPTPEARFITIHAEGDYSASVPLNAVRDQAILIYTLENGPLPRDKGGPIRFFIPDVAACQTDEVDQCANVKYVHSIVLSPEPGADTRPRTLAQHVELHRD